MVVSLYVGGKSNMFQMGKMYLLRRPEKDRGILFDAPGRIVRRPGRHPKKRTFINKSPLHEGAKTCLWPDSKTTLGLREKIGEV